MKVSVKLFAVAKQAAGCDELALDVANGATVADVAEAVVVAVPALEGVLAHARWAVDAKFVDENQPVTADSEIALIPPVSGG